MQTSLTIHKPTELQLSAPVQGLSIYENKAVVAWQSPKVADRMLQDKEQTEKALAAVITIKLQDAARKSGVSKSITGEEQSLITADIIEVIQEFPRLRLAEVALIFDLGAIGRFGDFQGHSINARTFRSWVIAFENQVRNELIQKQVDAERIAEEMKASANPFKSSRLADLLLGDSLVRTYSEMVANRKDEVPFSESSVPGDIDLSRIWFKRFKDAGLLDKLAPLSSEEKRKIFAAQLDKIKFMRFQIGAHWSEDERKARARIMSEDIWFRKAIANLVNMGTMPEDFEAMLIREKLIPSDWRAEIETIRKEAVSC